MKSGLAISMLAVGLCGCSMVPKDGTIPTGSWEGRGIYSGRDMATDEKNEATSHPTYKPGHSAEYDVKLTIEPVRKIANMLELKVYANHTKDPDFEGKSVFVRVLLEKAERASPTVNIYEVVSKGYDISFKEPKKLNDVNPPLMASCMSFGDQTVLVLRYEPDFIEEYRFQGNKVFKTGSFGSKDNCIHWTEELDKK